MSAEVSKRGTRIKTPFPGCKLVVLHTGRVVLRIVAERKWLDALEERGYLGPLDRMLAPFSAPSIRRASSLLSALKKNLFGKQARRLRQVEKNSFCKRAVEKVHSGKRAERKSLAFVSPVTD